MNNKIGIWLDKKQAFLIRFKDDGQGFVQQIDSNIEDFHVTGGAHSKTPYGSTDVVSETKYLERQKHQMHRYFESIIKEIRDMEEVYLFGPADTKLKLRDELSNNSKFRGVVRKTETADNMTERQMIATVRKVFEKKTS